MYLQLNKIAKSYDDTSVVRDLDLVIQKGEILCLLGPSGCGKTTTLKMISGLLKPDTGSIILDGEDITNLPPEKRSVSTVFQNYALFPHMTVLQNITYGLKLRKVAKSEREQKGLEYLEMAGLNGYEKAYVSELSGGEQQRVALMRSLILQPKILLLDEPLSNLDARLRERMRIEIAELCERFGLTMLFVTHDREEAMVIASRVAVMHEGKILQIGSPEELYQHPKNKFVADFFGDVNILESEDGIKHRLRPEDIHFDPEGAWHGTIIRSDYFGFYRLYRVLLSSGEVEVLTSKEEEYSPMQEVRLTINNNYLLP